MKMQFPTQEELQIIMEKYQDKEGSVENLESMLKDLFKNSMQTMLEAEMDTHLGYEKHSNIWDKSWNSRNGYNTKQVITNSWKMELSVPRDRNAEFEPILVPKRQTNISNLENKIISMYGLWLSNADITAHIQEIYWVEHSEGLISNITNKILEEVFDWQKRPLSATYPIIYLDAIHYKVRDSWHIVNKASYIILWIDTDGKKDVLGIYVWENEWAKFWLWVVNDLASRWVKDILIACIDGLKGFPEAINSVFPKTQIQLCIIHQIRNSFKHLHYKDSKEFMTDLKTIYTAQNEQIWLDNLAKMEEKWGKKYYYVFKSWRENWSNLATFFIYPEEIRRIIYTTNAIENFNRWLRKYTKTKVIFPTDSSLLKSLYLAQRNITRNWTPKTHNWWKILSQFQIYFEGRI